MCRGLSVTPEWIIEKTGIKRRYIAAKDDRASDYATEAAAEALAMAGVSAEQIDLVIGCTFSGDYIYPPVSAKVQQNIKAQHAQIFDLQANCCGFVTGLTVASDRMLVDSEVRHALVIGVEFCSRYIDRTDVNTAIYLSDGAGAAVLSRIAPGSGILGSAFLTDSSNYEAVRMRGGGSSFPTHGREFDPTIDLMEMNGLATWKQAITHLPTVIRRACAKASVNLSDVDFFIFHQANYNLIDYVIRKIGFDLSRTYTNVQEIGNTGSASPAIALSEAVAKGLLEPGKLVVIAAVGAGFNFAANVWKWSLKGGGSADVQ